MGKNQFMRCVEDECWDGGKEFWLPRGLGEFTGMERRAHLPLEGCVLLFPTTDPDCWWRDPDLWKI